ncbi:MAG: GNAT family N-acetyltransferase, partial [Chitinophagaceae bacterium]
LLRKIQASDNLALAKIVRDSLAEFGANKPGTVFFDVTTDHLFELFQQPGSDYFVAEEDGRIFGGGGIFPSKGLPEGVCELVKMYLIKEGRGKGLGQSLIDKCIDLAKAHGYRTIYLETMPELKTALSVYAKKGFEYLNGPMGDTGHFGCELWMKKEI